MYKMDKSIGKGKTFAEAEKDKIFPKETTPAERLQQSWYLTCMAYGIDPLNPPKMDKTISSSRKHAL
jgi:hypothetical protein